MIAVVDYGVGNLFSLASSLSMIGETAVVTGEARVLREAERLILPGVGAFGDARKKLAENGLDEAVVREAERGKPVMGICVGMQLLFERSFEFGEHAGLSLIPGEVVDMTPRLPKGLKVPHIGWNALRLQKPEHPVFRSIAEGECMYFVHSFYADGCAPYVIADTEYGIALTAAAGKDNVLGCQFHPEKSGRAGLSLLKSFCEWEG